jgi:hypothetical protein
VNGAEYWGGLERSIGMLRQEHFLAFQRLHTHAVSNSTPRLIKEIQQ